MSNRFRIPTLALLSILAMHIPAGGGAAPVGTAPVVATATDGDPIGIANGTELDVSVRRLGGSGLEITALTQGVDGTPLSVKFLLAEDGRIAFSLPSQPERLYSFYRSADRLAAEVTEIEFAEVAQAD